MTRKLAAAVAVFLAGCGTAPTTGEEPPVTTPEAWEAVSRDSLDELVRLQLFDGDRLLFRTPGTEDHALVAGLLLDEVAARGFEVWQVRFNATTPLTGPVEGRNIWGKSGSGPWIVLAAHWDSRAIADKDPDPAKRSQPIAGANDGAAAVAVVVEAATILKDHVHNHTVAVALFDLEDQGRSGCHEWAIGSRHDAAMYAREAGALVLVDMPGDPELRVPREGHSQRDAPWLLDIVFAQAARLNATAFVDTPGPPICDDHVPWLQQGVPAADLLHLDAGADPFPDTHHTTLDDYEHLSLDRMAEVARVVVATVIELDRRGP